MYSHTCLKPAAISSGTASRNNEAKNIMNAIKPPCCHPLGLASGSLINQNCGGGGGTRTPKRLRAAVFKTADLPISLRLRANRTTNITDSQQVTKARKKSG